MGDVGDVGDVGETDAVGVDCGTAYAIDISVGEDEEVDVLVEEVSSTRLKEEVSFCPALMRSVGKS